MEHEKDNKEISKKAKAIIAGSVAAGVIASVAVVSVVCLKNNNNDTTYSVSISSELDGFEDRDLTVKQGTKIKDLKSMILSSIEGYKVAGFYKDVNCEIPYDDNELIDENTKIYIKFDVATSIVRVFESTSSTSPFIEIEVEYNKSIKLTEPVKAPDEVGSYKFVGWVDRNGNPVKLTNITENLDIYASFEVDVYNEYTIATIPSQLSVSVWKDNAMSEISQGQKLSYGSRLKVVVSQTDGYKMTKLNAIGAQKVEVEEADSNVFWFEVNGDGEISFEYEEKYIYSLVKISDLVSMYSSNNNQIKVGDEILDGDIVRLVFSTGVDLKNYEISLEGLFPIEGLGAEENTYIVRGNVSIFLDEDVAYLDYVLTSDGNGYEVSRLNDDTVTDIVIPRMHNGKPVIGIGYNVFNDTNRERVKSITFPDTMQYIGIIAGLKNVTTLVIPDSVTSTLNNAFSNLTSLVEIKLSENLTRIETGLFSGCVSLKNLYIPEKVTSISGDAFLGCEFDSIRVSEKNSTFTSRDAFGQEINGIIQKERKQLILGCSTTRIPSDSSLVTSIGGYGFAGCKKLTSIVIPDNITAIYEMENMMTMERSGPGVFADCVNLISVILPSTLTKLGSKTFAGCTSLTEITIPSNVSTFYLDDMMGMGGGTLGTFYGCINLKTVIIESQDVLNMIDGLGSVGYLIWNATTIKVNKNIDNGTNSYLSKACTVVESDGYNVYTNLDVVGDLRFNQVDDGYEIVGVDASVTDIVIPSYHRGQPVVSIATGFYSRKINSFTLPETLKSIKGNIFSEATVNEVYFLGTLEQWSQIDFEYLESNPVNYGTKFFVNGNEVKGEIEISGVSTVKQYTFCRIDGLTSLVIGDGVEKIEQYAFGFCSNLAYIRVPESVKYIGVDAFSPGSSVVRTVVIESADVYNMEVKSNYCAGYVGNLLTKAKEVRVLKSIVDNTSNSNVYLNNLNKFSQLVDGDYYVYTSR